MFDEAISVTPDESSHTANARPPTPDYAEIQRALNTVWANYDRVELRVIYPEDKNGRRQTAGGVFDAAHLPQLVDAAIKSNATGAVYATLNPIASTYQPTSINAIRANAKGLVKDADIARRPRWPPQTAPLMAGQTAPGKTIKL